MTAVAILGGTGAVGRGLAGRWARAGLTVIIGSRDAARAEQAAARLRERLPAADVRGMNNEHAARAGDIAVLTVPFDKQAETLSAVREALAGKILVDVSVPLVPPRVARVQMPAAGCAALAAQAVVGDAVRVVSAFQNVSAAHLQSEGDIDCDVLVAGDKVADRDQVVELVARAGMRGIHAGPLANAVAAEALTSVLIHINKRYGAEGAGLRITGIQP